MAQRYLGGIITANPTEPSSSLSNASASGMWTLQEALSFYRAGDWPDIANVPSVGLFMGGNPSGSGYTNTVDKVVPESAGNATDFGDLTNSVQVGSGCSSDTRAIYAGGFIASEYVNVTQFFTFSTTGNATDFGDMSSAIGYGSGSSNNVRGVIVAGVYASDGTSPANNVDLLTISTLGNSVDFGNLSVARYALGSFSSSTRSVNGGGYGSGAVDTIDYFTIASVGNATDFGNLTVAKYETTGASSSNTRGLFAGGNTGSAVNVIEYITIASTGNGTDFGDMSAVSVNLGSLANSTKSLFAGNGSPTNVIEQVTIATTSNATDFGDLTLARGYIVGVCSGTEAVQPAYSITSLASAGNIGVMLAVSASHIIDINTTGNSTMFGNLKMGTPTGKNQTAINGNDVRGIIIGGPEADNSETYSNIIDYFNYHSSGGLTDFGDLTITSIIGTATANETRMVNATARQTGTGAGNVIDYITITSTGNATDFGDMTTPRAYLRSAQSSTRGLFVGGQNNSQAYQDTIEYVTMASTGNSVDFGNLSEEKAATGGVESTTRAVFGGGFKSGANVNAIEYVTIASTSNVTDFGDLTTTRYPFASGLSNQTRGVFSGMAASDVTMDYITIASTGNAQDFGDLVGLAVYGYGDGKSNGHGGIDRSTAFASLPATIGLLGAGNYTSTFIEYIDIATTGNGRGFGDLLYPGRTTGTASSSTRNVVGGRRTSAARHDHIDFSTYSTKGKAVDFGNLTQNGDGGGGGVSNGTRGVISIGYDGSAYSNALEYVTIASEGNATDFGDLVDDANANATGVSNTTIGLFTGSGSNTGDNGAKIDAITIASTGNATDFGDRSVAVYSVGAVSNSTRGVFAGGSQADGTLLNVMDYVTFSSAGNATDFGDLTTSRRSVGGGMSNSTRGVFAQWSDSVSNNVMDYITIASVGNATDFGDQIGLHTNGYGDSNGHGGIA